MLNIKSIICLLLTAINISAIDNNSSYYSDPVINYLLGYENSTQSGEDKDVDKPVLIAGIWKCGDCTDIDVSKLALLYSEDNYIYDADASDDNDDDVETQIEVMVQDMKCVTVSADKPGVVRRITGSCDGAAVTLHMAPSQHFIIQVYV